MAGLTTVPAVIRDLTDSEVMQLALIENLQREDLKPLEEANGYKMLMVTSSSRRRRLQKQWANPARRSRMHCGF